MKSRGYPGRFLAIVAGTLFFLNLTAIESNGAYGVPFFYFTRPQLALDLSYEYDQENRKGPHTNRNDYTTTTREGFDLSTKGWVYHPSLLQFTARFEPEWEQELRRGSTRLRERDDSFFTGYFLNISILKEKPYTLEIFGIKQKSTQKSSFADRTNVESDNYGARLFLKYRAYPTTLAYIHDSTEQKGFFDTDEVTDRYILDSRHITERSRTYLKGERYERDRSVVGSSTDTKISSIDLNNLYRLTEDGRLNLGSGAGYSSRSGGQERSNYGLSESLQWAHRRNLESTYDLSYSRQSVPDYGRETLDGRIGLTHQLYENLTTGLSVYGTSDTFTVGRRNLYGGSADFAYRRRIPGGNINLTVGQEYYITEDNVDQKNIQILDESKVLQTGSVTLLDNENIDLATIIVTDVTGSIIYLENIDYTLTVIGTRVRISRSAFGSITDGQAVLVDYRFLSNPAADFSTYTQSYGARLFFFNAISLYYQYGLTREVLKSGIPSPFFGATRTEVRGAELNYEWKWSRTHGLYEEEDSSEVPITRWLAEETLSFRPHRDFFWTISGSLGNTRFPDIGDSEDFYNAETNMEWNISSHSNFETELFYRKISGMAERTVDTGVSSLFEYVYNIWHFELRYHFLYEDNEINGEKRRNHNIFVQIRRELF